MPRTATAIFSFLLAWNAWAGYREVLSTTIGPVQSGKTNNTNAFDWSDPAEPIPAGCDLNRYVQQFGHQPCRPEMQWVCSRHFKISVCLDRDLVLGANGRPAGDISRVSCENFCRSQGKRLPTNNEWLVGCNQTPIAQCLNYGGEWPPGYFAKIKGHPCQVHGATSSECMHHPDLTALLPVQDPACRSEAEVNACVGTLGQWVSDTPKAGRGQFNGGLFPQRASSVAYTTTAHSPSYSDYSIGCRCAL